MAVKLAGLSPKDAAEQRATLIEQARGLNEQHADEWNDEYQAQYDEMIADASSLGEHCQRMSQLNELEQASVAVTESSIAPDPQEAPRDRQARESDSRTIVVRDGNNADGSPRYVTIEASDGRGSDEYERGFSRYLKTGRGQVGLHVAPDGQNGISKTMALQSDDAEQAGYLVASEQFASELLREVDDLVFVRRYARIHTVREASSLGIRARTSRAQTFDWSQELTVSAEDDSLKYGKRILTPHHLTGSVKVSRDLVRRSVISADGEVRGELARDAGEVMEDAYLTGDGAQKPLGVFTASADGISTGRDVSSGSATNITSDALINAKYHMKGQYRSGARGPVRWLFNRTGINKIALLKDNDGQYLFRVGMGVAQDTGAPEDLLLGYPVDESERAPGTFTTGQYVGCLANWRYYEIADALDMEVQVLYELNARTNQYEYIGRLKTDGMPTLEEAFVRLITD